MPAGLLCYLFIIWFQQPVFYGWMDLFTSLYIHIWKVPSNQVCACPWLSEINIEFASKSSILFYKWFGWEMPFGIVTIMFLRRSKRSDDYLKTTMMMPINSYFAVPSVKALFPACKQIHNFLFWCKTNFHFKQCIKLYEQGFKRSFQTPKRLEKLGMKWSQMLNQRDLNIFCKHCGHRQAVT